MKKLIILLCLLPYLTSGQTKYQKDFDEFWTIVNENYAYFQEQGIDWIKVKEIYKPSADTITNYDQFVRLLENMLNELYNGHSSLNTNLETSNRLIPTGSDIFIERINNKYIITDLRKGFGAEQCGLKVGMEVLNFNDKEIEEQLNQFLPRYTNNHNPRMFNYAISMLFAGTHDKPRKIKILENGFQKDYFPDNFKSENNNEIIEDRIINYNTGYIKINNSLGDNNLIFEFDKILDSLMTTSNLIIDLTETPSGGNTTVARAIMGRFIDKKMPYQEHEVDEIEFEFKQSWVEYVIPRKTTYNGKVIIMVGHWTGSMGEGIAIGFVGMNRATIVGTEMAGLIGAINKFTLTETKISFQIPTERLYHINGTAREDYKPEILTENSEQTWEQVKKILANSYNVK